VIRDLLRRWLSIENYNQTPICHTCIVLKEQLDYERSRNKEVTEVLLEILRPKQVNIENKNLTLQPFTPNAGVFSRRRAELEKADREQAKILRTSKVVAKPNELKLETEKEKKAQVSITELESELGIVSEDNQSA
jgi:hypothetical protein